MSYYLPLPHVVENDGRTERSWDIYSRLMKERIIFIGTPIDDFVANGVIAQLLFLQMEDPKKDINIYINTPGGSVTDGMAIYDTMNYLRSDCDVNTFCLGLAASMGTVLLSAGTPGKRFALPHSRIMIHQPTSSVTGQAADVTIAAREILRWKRIINEILAEHTGQPADRLETDSDRDYYMTAEEAKDYGIIDQIIKFKGEKKKTA